MVAQGLCSILLLAFGVCGFAAQPTIIAPKKGGFPNPKPIKIEYRCGWAALVGGEISATIHSSENHLLEFDAQGRSTGFVRSVWSMDFSLQCLIDSLTLRPRKMQLTEVYPLKTFNTRLEFEEKQVRRIREVTPPDKTPPKWKRFVHPGVLDMSAALLLIRSQKLAPGDVYEMVIYPQTSAYAAQVRVVGPQTIYLQETPTKAIRLDLQLQKLTKSLERLPHEDYKKGTVWLSDDADRVLLKAKAEIFVGSVWVELYKKTYLDDQRTQIPR